MADTKISALTASTTPLAGTEVLPIVQSGTTKKVSVDDLTTGKTVPVGVLSVTGTIPRITADMSNATQANRLMFQTTTANATSSVGVIPSGTGTSSRLNLFNSSDPDNAGYAQFNSSTAATIINSLKLGTGTTLPIRLQIDGSTQAELSTTGNLTLFTGNLIIGTAGKGIDFSATSGAGTSELLADYEEGTWTPGISFGGASVGVTFTGTSGFYTKVGNVVTVSCYANMSSKGTSIGAARITALPFTCANSTAAYAAPALLFTNITYLGQVSGYVNINDNTIDLFQTTELGVASALLNTNFANNTSIIINLTYRTA
jgi:hypothetical protein